MSGNLVGGLDIVIRGWYLATVLELLIVLRVSRLIIALALSLYWSIDYSQLSLSLLNFY